jgi:hypothetical protein
MFKLDGEFIVNEHGKVMNIDGSIDAENRNIIMNNKDGKINQ